MAQQIPTQNDDDAFTFGGLAVNLSTNLVY